MERALKESKKEARIFVLPCNFSHDAKAIHFFLVRLKRVQLMQNIL